MNFTTEQLARLTSALRGDIGNYAPEDEARSEINELLDMISAERTARLKRKPVTQSVAVGQLWNHIKTGGIYRVTELSVCERDHVQLVNYRSISELDTIWSREASEFLDGRFKYMGDAAPAEFKANAIWRPEHNATYLCTQDNREAWIALADVGPAVGVMLGYDIKTERLTSIMLPGKHDERKRK